MPPKPNTDLEDIKKMFNEINIEMDGIVKETKEITEKFSNIEMEQKKLKKETETENKKIASRNPHT